MAEPTEGVEVREAEASEPGTGCFRGCAVVAVVLLLLVAYCVPNLHTGGHRPSPYVTAIVTLRVFATAQTQFIREDHYAIGRNVYANPVDGRGMPDLFEVGGEEIRLIDRLTAQARTPESARNGYYYFVDITGHADGRDFDYEKEFGLCAVPARYHKDTKDTFIIGPSGAIYSKDTGGEPVTRFPDVDDPASGWTNISREWEQ